MFPHQVRSKTQEIQGSSIEEAVSNLAYSKSFNASEANKPAGGFLRPKVRLFAVD